MYVRYVLQTERSLPSVLRLLNTFLLPNPFVPTPPPSPPPFSVSLSPFVKVKLCDGICLGGCGVSGMLAHYGKSVKSRGWWCKKKKKKKDAKKKTQNKTQGLQRIKKMRKKRNKTSVCLLFPSDMFYVRRCLWVIKWKKGNKHTDKNRETIWQLRLQGVFCSELPQTNKITASLGK